MAQTSATSLVVGDGKHWIHKGKYLGDLIEKSSSQYGGKMVKYIFRKGEVWSGNFAEQFTEVSLPITDDTIDIAKTADIAAAASAKAKSAAADNAREERSAAASLLSRRAAENTAAKFAAAKANINIDNTPYTTLIKGDGKTWSHNGKYMGEFFGWKRENENRPDTDIICTFEKGLITGLALKFTELPGKIDKIDKIPYTDLRHDDGKCYKHNEKYLGKYLGRMLVADNKNYICMFQGGDITTVDSVLFVNETRCPPPRKTGGKRKTKKKIGRKRNNRSKRN